MVVGDELYLAYRGHVLCLQCSNSSARRLVDLPTWESMVTCRRNRVAVWYCSSAGSCTEMVVVLVVEMVEEQEAGSGVVKEGDEVSEPAQASGRSIYCSVGVVRRLGVEPSWAEVSWRPILGGGGRRKWKVGKDGMVGQHRAGELDRARARLGSGRPVIRVSV